MGGDPTYCGIPEKIIFNSASRLSLLASLPRVRSLWLVQSLESGSSLMRPPGDNGFHDDDVVPDGVVHDVQLGLGHRVDLVRLHDHLATL